KRLRHHEHGRVHPYAGGRHGWHRGDDPRSPRKSNVSRRPQPGDDSRPDSIGEPVHPGEYFLDDGEVELNAGRPTVQVVVSNRGDRPVQVGSHYHFFEVNSALDFDRAAAYGMRLNIAAGTAIRFEPGEEKEVPLVALAGSRAVYGHNGKVNGALGK